MGMNKTIQLFNYRAVYRNFEFGIWKKEVGGGGGGS